MKTYTEELNEIPEEDYATLTYFNFLMTSLIYGFFYEFKREKISLKISDNKYIDMFRTPNDVAIKINNAEYIFVSNLGSNVLAEIVDQLVKEGLIDG